MHCGPLPPQIQMPRTCALCRERSIPCDGVTPICGQCTEFGAADTCDFSSRATVTTPNISSGLLQKGAACLPCRRKKKKCDAKRPYCTTCKSTSKQAQCLYEDDAQRSLIKSLVQRTRRLEQRLASTEQSSQTTPTLAESSGSDAPAQSAPPLPINTMGVFPTWKPSFLDRPVLNDPPSSLTTLQRFRDFRLCFLAYSGHFGINLTAEAVDALTNGDFHSPHIHPALIHAAQLNGSMIWQEFRRLRPLSRMEALELEATLSLLTEDTPPITILQVHNILTVYFYSRRMLHEGSEQIRLACEVVHRYGLRFIPPSVDIWESFLALKPELEYLVYALSQLLYTNLDRSLYETEFVSIPLMYPAFARTNLSILRARGALLMARTCQLSTRLPTLPGSPWEGLRNKNSPPCTWLTDYWSLLEDVEVHLSIVNPTLLKASTPGVELSPTPGLKICLIVALTAEAELHHLTPVSHAESRQHCLNAILKLVGIAKTFTANDYEMLDPLLGVCWSMATKVAFVESSQPMDELTAMNWATARSVLVACVPGLVKSLPYLADLLTQTLERESSLTRA
ncbi:hypothetical protein C8Q80DRAFT_1339871 [Daedaleopsis nitida]|nr:hypothetical protein C8Q80DRAFT_1339871 [Daedaleopsis nitida]